MAGRGREALWQAACLPLELVWYDGGEALEALFADEGCVRVRADLEQSGGAAGTLRAIGRHREDVAVYLGGSGSLELLPDLLRGLEEGRYRISAWRLTA